MNQLVLKKYEGRSPCFGRWNQVVVVHTRFLEKFISWSWTWVDVVSLLILLRCDSISRIWSSDSLSTGCLRLIWRKRSTWCSWSFLNVYAWFGEVKHVMFFKLVECLCLIWGSRTRDVLEVGVLKESLYLQRNFNLRGKLESWKKSCIFKRASIFEDGWLQELGSLLVLGRILFEPSEVKNFQPLQMRRIPLFIEFIGGL